MNEQLQENIKEIKPLNENSQFKKIEPTNIILPKVNDNPSTNEVQIKLPTWSIEPPIEISRGQK